MYLAATVANAPILIRGPSRETPSADTAFSFVCRSQRIGVLTVSIRSFLFRLSLVFCQFSLANTSWGAVFAVSEFPWDLVAANKTCLNSYHLRPLFSFCHIYAHLFSINISSIDFHKAGVSSISSSASHTASTPLTPLSRLLSARL